MMANHKINLKINELELGIIIKIVGLVLEALKLLQSKKHNESIKTEVDLLSFNKELQDAHGSSNNESEVDSEGVA